MNIVGEGLPEAIGNQVKTRQKIYGSLNRTPEQLLYLNSRTSFVKAISSVNIENYDTTSRPELKEILKEYGGDKLAKNFILFNGTSKEGGSLRAGIPQQLLTGADQYVNNLAYGLGGLEYGVRPMPGIISMQTTSKGTYGSVEETTLNIKAWNRVQFEIIDLLYLRLGYSVLVEWGNTSYFDNNKKYIPENQYTLEPEFLNGSLNPDNIYSKIQSYKLKSNGNYDAIYGIVTNFDWTFDRDGGYNINVKLISKGDIIESIKSMVLVSQDNSISTLEIPDTLFNNYINPIVSDTIENTIDKVNKLATRNATTTTSSPTVEENPSVDAPKDAHTIARLYYNVRKAFKDISTDSETLSQAYFQQDSKDTIPYITQVYTGPDSDKGKENGPPKKYYIRLGSLLSFIQANLIPKEKQGDSLYSSIKIDYATKSNLIYTNPYQVSVDPNVCLINTEITPVETTQIPNLPTTYKFASQGSPFKTTISGIQVGQLMNVYVNFEHLINVISSNGDPKNQTSVLTLIETLCNDISVSLGGINTLRPFIDTSTNTLKIIDETALPNKNSIIESLGGRSTAKDPTFQIYGYNNPLTLGEAGFVRDFRFTSKLDPKFAQIISIGATSQGGIVGEDATAFTTLNRGLKDRIKPEIFASTGYSTNSTINIENTSPEDQFKESLTNFEKYLGSIGYPKNNPYPPTLNETETSSYKTLLTNIMLYIETRTAVKAKKSSGTMGFIPVSVGLTLDGLSGLKLLNGIKVDTSYLPSNYPETMLFVISKLAHKVENNIWTTELETIMTPTDVSQPVDTPKAKPRRSSGANIGSNQTTGREAITTAEQNRRGVQIINFFIGKGLTQEQAAGIAGNFFAESGLQLNIVNSIGAYGLAQWLGQRKQNLFTFASNRSESVGNISLETQLEFTWNELQTTESSALRNLKSQNTVADAATSFVNGFERPNAAEIAQSLNKRISYAQKFLKEYKA